MASGWKGDGREKKGEETILHIFVKTEVHFVLFQAILI